METKIVASRLMILFLQPKELTAAGDCIRNPKVRADGHGHIRGIKPCQGRSEVERGLQHEPNRIRWRGEDNLVSVLPRIQKYGHHSEYRSIPKSAASRGCAIEIAVAPQRQSALRIRAIREV